ncbi:hypothetical protein B0T25DRAFT_190582 [Lasiosphaeria hispida]|uniref:Uncharacterized protein n=1 Tax=Lasiosphaeria hispida TaxID=260671 RepID=A0AAJ0HH99_9PEZI|nr:hypothetical protein B0T25DRAFT_190582 [Lasiosphaeria hispida]
MALRTLRIPDCACLAQWTWAFPRGILERSSSRADEGGSMTFHIAAVLASRSVFSSSMNLDRCPVGRHCSGAILRACTGCSWLVGVQKKSPKANECWKPHLASAIGLRAMPPI